MPRFAYVDGRFVRHGNASVHIEDRGLQFGDAVYEVWAVRDGVLFDHAGHLARLGRSLAALRMETPLNEVGLVLVIAELVRRNKLRNGLIYLQITRGTARRDHPFPKSARPSLILTARAMDMAIGDQKAALGITVKTMPDTRWGRVDIKTTNLLPNVLAKQAALEAGFGDAWLVDEAGFVTEGTAQNAWIVDAEGMLRTRPSGHDILRGITRDAIIATASQLGFSLQERAFTLHEAYGAQEAFITSATSFVTPVVRIDEAQIGSGAPGPIAKALRQTYLEQQTTARTR
ncbi:MAG: D-amino-acid transaminase [Hyphomonadaceae bacterium]|nr:D-amino-acid transaminase [Hyphomonadaceae bacterium]